MIYIVRSHYDNVSKSFSKGRSQAVRIPKEYRVDSDEVYIEKIGDTLVLKPKSKNNLDDLFDALNALDT